MAEKLKRRMCLFGILLIWCIHVQAWQAPRTEQIEHLLSALYERGQFNGAIMVALQGNIIYRNAFGKADFETNRTWTPETPSCLASVSKQFTAMAIMMLAEQNKLSFDDPVGKYISEFSLSPRTSQITLRQLLTHTSGIPDYGDLGVDDSKLNQHSLVDAIVKRMSLLSKPGQRFRYSNPGYALLAIVVERASSQGLSDFLARRIFQPLGMDATYVYDSSRKRNPRAAVGYDQFGQRDDTTPTSVPGDGGIYSTVDDLLKWDHALYTDKLVKQSTLSIAFTPARVEEGSSTYGFGWNVTGTGEEKYVWHTGNTAGFRSFIGRHLGPRVTVIMLTNRGNSKRIEINSAIMNILAGKPYTLPTRSGAEKLYTTIHDSGIRTALQTYQSLKNTGSADYDFGESELNALGYQMLYGDKHVSDAIAIFELNTTEHPASSNAFDSLGEAYRQAGDKGLAIKSYENAIKLDAKNLHAAAMLKELR